MHAVVPTRTGTAWIIFLATNRHHQPCPRLATKHPKKTMNEISSAAIQASLLWFGRLEPLDCAVGDTLPALCWVSTALCRACFPRLVHFYRKLDGICGCLRAEVVHACFQSQLP